LKCTENLNNCLVCAENRINPPLCECKEGYMESSSEVACFASCPNGQYAESLTKTCKICHESCKTCSGPSGLDCLTCD
jgi:proprotein convertase subtilisin/kexin type 5